ncbi:MAG TPA: 2TM domain-containing protein [Stellaceae bacterium]|nr:2TM domain-containing protein [Stellaceae bacterium]
MTDGSPLLIQKLRLQRGWSQEQLAELTGLSVRTIQRLERGQNPSVESLKAVAAVLEADFGALREAHMTPPVNHNVSADEALALARVRKIKSFYMHIVEYVLIIGFLAILNLFVYPSHFWVGWPAIPWGLYLAMDGLRAFDKIPFLNADWERRAVEKYLGRRL